MATFLNNGGIELLLVTGIGVGAIVRTKIKERRKKRYVTLYLKR